MNIARALKLRDQYRDKLRGLYSHSAAFGTPSNVMETARRGHYAELRARKVPQWVRTYLDGYWACKIEHAYSADLVYGGFLAGVFYSTHKDRADYYEAHGIQPARWADGAGITAKGHYWRATLRPFFTDKQGEG